MCAALISITSKLSFQNRWIQVANIARCSLSLQVTLASPITAASHAVKTKVHLRHPIPAVRYVVVCCFPRTSKPAQCVCINLYLSGSPPATNTNADQIPIVDSRPQMLPEDSEQQLAVPPASADSAVRCLQRQSCVHNQALSLCCRISPFSCVVVNGSAWRLVPQATIGSSC